jgi:radical SAM protein with 4Fe4S-binding SPASM domain
MKKSRVHLESPFRVGSSDSWTLHVDDDGLISSGEHFVRLDMYPLVSPHAGKRHYGFVDIPLSGIREGETAFRYDFTRGTLSGTGGGKRGSPSRSWKGPLGERGYIKLHCSLWKGDGTENSELLETSSSVHFLSGGDGDVPMKQINIPVTDRCNLKCTMCPRQNTEGIVEADIEADVLGPLLDSCSEVVCVLLQGLGEPLLYPDLEHLVGEVGKRLPDGGEVGLTTNATILTVERAAGLMDAGIDFIYFSVDAASPRTYKKIRVGADLDRVRANIEGCAAYRSKRNLNKTRFMMNCVVMENNYRELPDYVRLSGELGIENVAFSHCIGSEDSAIDRKELAGIYNLARDIGQRAGINVYCPPAFPLKEERCLFMERVVALRSGEVLPCHAMAPGYSTSVRSRSFGNVRQSSLRDIWNHANFRTFRQRVAAGDFPGECTTCPCKAFLVP